MNDMRQQFQMHAQTDALAQSTGAVTGQVLKRVAHLEGVVQRDAVALQQVQSQLRVSQAQGLQHGAGVGGGASAADVAAAAASAAQSARVRVVMHMCRGSVGMALCVCTAAVQACLRGCAGSDSNTCTVVTSGR